MKNWPPNLPVLRRGRLYHVAEVTFNQNWASVAAALSPFLMCRAAGIIRVLEQLADSQHKYILFKKLQKHHSGWQGCVLDWGSLLLHRSHAVTDAVTTCAFTRPSAVLNHSTQHWLPRPQGPVAQRSFSPDVPQKSRSTQPRTGMHLTSAVAVVSPAKRSLDDRSRASLVLFRASFSAQMPPIPDA